MTVEIEARLDLIHLSILVLGGLDNVMEHHEIYGLIEVLCRRRDLDVNGCLSQPRREILLREDRDEFLEWEAKHVACLKSER